MDEVPSAVVGVCHIKDLGRGWRDAVIILDEVQTWGYPVEGGVLRH
jgi:hypothetical protein